MPSSDKPSTSFLQGAVVVHCRCRAFGEGLENLIGSMMLALLVLHRGFQGRRSRQLCKADLAAVNLLVTCGCSSGASCRGADGLYGKEGCGAYSKAPWNDVDTASFMIEQLGRSLRIGACIDNLLWILNRLSLLYP